MIGNQVWIETDLNGYYNPETGDVGQAGVTVQLYKDGQWYGVTTTGASGDYSFIGLPAGVYSVTREQTLRCVERLRTHHLCHEPDRSGVYVRGCGCDAASDRR